ncbi:MULTISPECIES: DUF3311 domain-containing protein [Streptomyces]|uniref:DUF3311 domain-containing protein n=1 Tax=Streptomyces silvisoli TaxID=3034235 RepID=A0ABT5ZIF9_9ACTN|nr:MULTISPECIES: DUF3311 domain-containing protein [Streptomyces]MDF3289466.1 DUF3311 domain-containing protein [Streptomyces silvisoli]
MTEPPPKSQPVITATRVVAAVCLILPFVATLWVSSYARPTPTFIGIPFFYWYQMAWVVISTGLTSIAYVLIRREERARRAEEREGAA